MLEKRLEILEKQKESSYYSILSDKEKEVDYLICDWLVNFIQARQRVLFKGGGNMVEYVNLRDLTTAVWKRTETIVHLDYLEAVLERVRGLTILDSSDENTGALARLQLEFLGDVRLQKKVMDYQKALEKAFYEFNKQTVVNLAHRASGLFVPPEWEEEHRLAQELKQTFGRNPRVLGTLDSRYYSAAIRLLQLSYTHHKELSADPVGSFFVMTFDEVQEARQIRMHSSDSVQ